MRYYIKPELNTEAFDVEDILTASGVLKEEPDLQEEFIDAPNPFGSMDVDLDAAALAHTTLPLDGEISGGSFVQENLNSLYENFLSRF